MANVSKQISTGWIVLRFCWGRREMEKVENNFPLSEQKSGGKCRSTLPQKMF